MQFDVKKQGKGTLSGDSHYSSILCSTASNSISARYLFLNNLHREEAIIRRRAENILDLPHNELIKEYRMPKIEILNLCELLKDKLTSLREGTRYLTIEEKVLISLKTLASGSFQNSAKDNVNVAQPTVSKVIGDFLEGILKKHPCLFQCLALGNKCNWSSKSYMMLPVFLELLAALMELIFQS